MFRERGGAGATASQRLSSSVPIEMGVECDASASHKHSHR